LLRVLVACEEFGGRCATGATADDVAMRLEQGFRIIMTAPVRSTPGLVEGRRLAARQCLSLVHRGVAMTASPRGDEMRVRVEDYRRAVRSGEGPFPIRFADLGHPCIGTGGTYAL